MDVTNPGLVNVANQAYGNPSTAVSSLAVPEDNDVLVPVANQGTPRAEDVTAVGGSTGPTPTSGNVIQQPPASPSQSRGEIPGVAPQFLPFPQNNIVNTVAQQDIPQSETAEFSVAAGTVIQTNQNTAVQRDYVVTKVLDADTGLPPVIPAPSAHGNFSAVQNTGGSTVTFVSPTPLTGSAALSSGEVVTIAGIPSPPGSPYDGIQQVSNVLSLGGPFAAAAASISGTKTTLGSTTPLPAGLSSAKVASITGAPYTGIHNISNIVSLPPGTFIAAGPTTPPGSQIIISSPTPTSLSNGQLINLPGTYNWRPVSNVLNFGGSFISAADSLVNPGVTTTLTASGSLPASLQNGQQVSITTGSGSGLYVGTWTVSNVDLIDGTFDISTPFIGTDSGNWSVYTFQITASLAATTGTWTAYTFDIDVVPGVTTSGSWAVYTFEITATYAGTAAGTWIAVTAPPTPTTRLKLYVTPVDLQSFGISLLGRILTFDNTTVTVADRKATRPITYFGQNYVIISVNEPDDPFAPVLTYPQVGDTFFIYVQRQNSEVFTDTAAPSQNVDVFPPGGGTPAQPPAPNPFVPQEQMSIGTVDVSVGPQPNQPIITSGVQVPTSITVNVADQATSVGLPKNIYV